MELRSKTPFQGITPVRFYRSESSSAVLSQTNRPTHVLVLKQQGSAEYRNTTKTVRLDAGEILFLKKGHLNSYREIDPGYAYVLTFQSEIADLETMTKLPLPPDYDMRPLARRLLRAYQEENLYGMLSLIYSLLEESAHAPDSVRVSHAERLYLMPVLQYLDEHLTDPELKIDTLHQMVDISDTYLRNLFKKRFGVTPARYVAQERIRLAKQLLTSTETTHVADIAAQVGYRDPLYFSRLFKKLTGLSPTEYHDMCAALF